MKIIVDKMPVQSDECLFSKPLNACNLTTFVCDFDSKLCKEIHQCPYLKPISDYAAEKPGRYYTDRTGAVVGSREFELFNLIDIE